MSGAGTCFYRSALLFCVLLPKFLAAQFSMGFNGAYVTSLSPEDPFALEKDWQDPSNFSELGFYDGANGIAYTFFLTWEATNHLSVGLFYRHMNFTNSANKREASDKNMGLTFKVNFVSHEKKIVPFTQLNVAIKGTHNLQQEQATDSRNQTQPSFDEDANIKFGAGVDVGVEFRLKHGLYTQLLGGFHAVNLQQDTGDTIKELYNSVVPTNTPDTIIGPLFLQFSAGLKYYFSKRKKKRDF